MEDTTHIEKGDADSPEHDTGGLSGRKFVRTNGFHPGILGGRRGFRRSRGPPRKRLALGDSQGDGAGYAVEFAGSANLTCTLLATGTHHVSAGAA